MNKQKQPEEPTAESQVCVEEAASTVQVEEPLESNMVEGWVIGSEPANNEEEVVVTIVDSKLEGETSREAKAFWALLTKAGYVRW